MKLLVRYPSLQRLDEVSPDNMCLVIEYADPSFEGRTVCDSLEPKIAIVMQVCNILQEMRNPGFAHNHIRPANICVRERGGPRVSLTDFGLTVVSGALPRLANRWE